MDTFSADPLSRTFAALADPTRRAILARLARGATRVGELAGPFGISGPAISRHLRVLENARLIERRVDAQWRICTLQPDGLRAADDWLRPYREYWEHNLDRLADVLEQQPPSPEDGAAKPPRPSAAARRTPSARTPSRRKPPGTRRPPPGPRRKSP